MMKSLDQIYEELALKLEPLGYMREELVFGSGGKNAGIMLVGEAPGKDEVRLHKPFVGKAGKNLDEFLEHTGLERKELFITNTVKFRPYKVSEKGTRSNRPPTAAERAMCAECLAAEIETLEPRLIVTLGNTALRAVAKNDKLNISALHGRAFTVEERRVFPLYHPASVIYRRELINVYMEDLDLLKSYLMDC